MLVLHVFQHKVLKHTKDVPDELKVALDHESFEKARVYQLDRSSFGFISGAYSQLETTVSQSLSVMRSFCKRFY